ncbi:hypothetical protein ACJX0J_041281, partial [Zea mays]
KDLPHALIDIYPYKVFVSLQRIFIGSKTAMIKKILTHIIDANISLCIKKVRYCDEQYSHIVTLVFHGDFPPNDNNKKLQSTFAFTHM